MIASIFGIGITVLAILGAVVGTYFFLRNNPAKKSVIDSAVNKAGSRL